MKLKGNLTNLPVYLFLVLCMVILNGCNAEKKPDKVESGPNPENSEKEQVDKEMIELPGYMAAGRKVYDKYCLSCHQTTGGGVPNLNPPLKATEYVVGDKNRLLGIIINGSNVGLEVNGSTYANAMPAFKTLNDEEVAHVASFIRNSFGNSAEPITTKEVSKFRADRQE